MIANFDRTRRGHEVHDILTAAFLFLFAAYSFIWPDTAFYTVNGLSVPAGYVHGIAFVLGGLVTLLLGRIDWSNKPRLVLFFRTFYPQLFFAPIFFQAILLSSQVNGGAYHDPIFAAIDQAIFGFQPSREFSRAFSGNFVVNEVLFGAYYLYFFMFAMTPWYAWLKGRQEEARREMATLAAYIIIVGTFYVFFRVMGPKYYFADLHASWYSEFNGGFFTGMLKKTFSTSTLFGAAFPSSHMALSLIMTVFISRGNKKLLPFYIVHTTLIALATIYLYAHWTSDLVAAGLFVAVFLPLFDRLYGPILRLVDKLNARPSLAPFPAAEEAGEPRAN